MTIAEWSAVVKGELEAAGFVVTECAGFPFVSPKSFDERFKMVGFRPSVSCEKRIYSDGMLLVPVGVGARIDRMKREETL